MNNLILMPSKLDLQSLPQLHFGTVEERLQASIQLRLMVARTMCTELNTVNDHPAKKHFNAGLDTSVAEQHYQCLLDEEGDEILISGIPIEQLNQFTNPAELMAFYMNVLSERHFSRGVRAGQFQLESVISNFSSLLARNGFKFKKE